MSCIGEVIDIVRWQAAEETSFSRMEMCVLPLHQSGGQHSQRDSIMDESFVCKDLVVCGHMGRVADGAPNYAKASGKWPRT